MSTEVDAEAERVEAGVEVTSTGNWSRGKE